MHNEDEKMGFMTENILTMRKPFCTLFYGLSYDHFLQRKDQMTKLPQMFFAKYLIVEKYGQQIKYKKVVDKLARGIIIMAVWVSIKVTTTQSAPVLALHLKCRIWKQNSTKILFCSRQGCRGRQNNKKLRLKIIHRSKIDKILHHLI